MSRSTFSWDWAKERKGTRQREQSARLRIAAFKYNLQFHVNGFLPAPAWGRSLGPALEKVRTKILTPAELLQICCSHTVRFEQCLKQRKRRRALQRRWFAAQRSRK